MLQFKVWFVSLRNINLFCIVLVTVDTTLMIIIRHSPRHATNLQQKTNSCQSKGFITGELRIIIVSISILALHGVI